MKENTTSATKSIEELKKLIRSVPDFPKPGILFQDLNPVLANGHLPSLVEHLSSKTKHLHFDVVGGIEARGFIYGAAMATHLSKGFVPIRKAGKLPPPTKKITYSLEYGTDCIEMQPGRGRMLLVDDVFATGGTLTAAAELAVQSGYEIAGLIVIQDIQLKPDYTWKGFKVLSLWGP